MTTLEKSIVSQATPADLKMFTGIIYQMDYYDCYYGKFCKYHLDIDYKEYQTLKEDLADYHEQVELLKFRVSISDVGSFKSSFEMLKRRYDSNTDNPNEAFKMFLTNAIQELTKFINQLLLPN
jgi:hypothetical protein